MRRLSVFLALAACSSPATKPPVVAPPPPPPPPVAVTPVPPPPPPEDPRIQHVSLADVGLEASSLDKTADPCVDFYQYTCGGWLAKNDIPADRARYARFTEIDEKNKVALRGLLDDAVKQGTTLGSYFGACMAEAEPTAKPSQEKAIAAIKDAKTWLAALEELHALGIWVFWRADGRADAKDSLNNVTYLDSGSLGLPDRDYYLKDDFKAKRDAYVASVGKMLALAGAKPEGATDVLAIETELAGLTKTAVERRDRLAAYNTADQKALAGRVKSVDWPSYWKALKVTPSTKLVIGTPKYVGAIDKLRAKFTWKQWQALFLYRFVSTEAVALGKAFDDQQFELEKALTGVEQRQERGKRCTDLTQRGLGELLGQQYVAKYFPAEAKAAAKQVVDSIVGAMGRQIGKLDWMSDATKQLAQQKLGKVVRMVGYPDTWRSYDVDVKANDFLGNLLRAQAFETHRRLARAGHPVDRSEWQMDAYEVNAYYESTANNTALPAGILQPPFFGANRSIQANLGGIGGVVGHELTHGFDDQGAKSDADGNLHDWWQPEDKTKFEAKGACVADQYSTFEAAPRQFVQGKLVLGESIADLGGVKMAFDAYRTARKDAAKLTVADGLTEDQQFFVAVGQVWCSKDRPAEIQRRLTVDPHAPPKFRVFGELRNLREFSTAFACAAGTPMNPANSCQVW